MIFICLWLFLGHSLGLSAHIGSCEDASLGPVCVLAGMTHGVDRSHYAAAGVKLGGDMEVSQGALHRVRYSSRERHIFDRHG